MGRDSFTGCSNRLTPLRIGNLESYGLGQPERSLTQLTNPRSFGEVAIR